MPGMASCHHIFHLTVPVCGKVLFQLSLRYNEVRELTASLMSEVCHDHNIQLESLLTSFVRRKRCTTIQLFEMIMLKLMLGLLVFGGVYTITIMYFDVQVLQLQIYYIRSVAS